MSYRKAQTSIQKKKKFSTFSARDFKEARKQFSSGSNSNSDGIKTPSSNRRPGHSVIDAKRNRAWTCKKANWTNNDITSSDNVKVFVRLRPTNNNIDNKTDEHDFTDSNDDDENAYPSSCPSF